MTDNDWYRLNIRDQIRCITDAYIRQHPGCTLHDVVEFIDSPTYRNEFRRCADPKQSLRMFIKRHIDKMIRQNYVVYVTNEHIRPNGHAVRYFAWKE